MSTGDRVGELLGQLTLSEKVALAAGSDVWHTTPVERLGIGRMKLSDGPSGVRGGSSSLGTSAVFPCGIALGATWDVDLLERIGSVMAEEAKTKGVHVVLGPTINIHRHPLGGRHFECYSEDPILTGRLAAGLVRGMQSHGVGATPKHFVCNDSEIERMTISSEVDSRTLREIYLRPFELVVTEAHPWALMTAYNRLNGTSCSEHEWLLTDLLRDEWGFDGLVVSDWYGTYSTVASSRAGLDLEMPGRARHFGDKLVAAVEAGDVEEATVCRQANNVLRAMSRTGALDVTAEPDEASIDAPSHRVLAHEAAVEAIVLLANDGLLPLAADVGQIALLGPNAAVGRVQGGGSAAVRPHYSVSPLEGLLARGVDLVVEPGCTTHRGVPTLDSAIDVSVEFYNSPDLSGEPVDGRSARALHFIWFGEFSPHIDPMQFSARVTGRYPVREAGPHTFSLVSAGVSRLFFDGELLVDNWTSQVPGEAFFGLGSTPVTATVDLTAGAEHELVVEYASTPAPAGLYGLTIGCLPPIPADLMERAVAAAAAAEVAVVVIGTSDDWETEGRDRESMELPGRQAELIERVATANPRTIVVVNTGSPVPMDWAERVGAVLQLWYPGQECGSALADVLFGDSDPGGRLPTTVPVHIEQTPALANYPGEGGQVQYAEGVFVGYRSYDERGIEPRFCFGHGLSYGATDDWSVTVDGRYVTVAVRNVSDRAMTEVVQLYVGHPDAPLPRPPQELRAFRKLHLGPGESSSAEFELTDRDLAYWDTASDTWITEPGEYELYIGRSSRDIEVVSSVTAS